MSGGPPLADAATAVSGAAALHAEGVRATADMRPADGGRILRQALRVLAECSTEDSGAGALRGRVLLSLAHAEAEQGHVEAGLRLLAEAEPLIPAARRGVLFGQRGLIHLRTGRHDLALPQLDAAVGALREPGDREDLAKVLLNRGVLQLGAGQLGLARADLRLCTELAAAGGLARIGAKARHNLAYLDFLAGDLPAALRRYHELRDDYAALMPAALPVLAVDRARALLAAGLFREADAELAAATEQFRQVGLSQDHAEAVLARAEAALLAGQPATTKRLATQARRSFLRRHNARWAAVASLADLRADLAMAADGHPGGVFARRTRILAAKLAGLGLHDDALVCELLGVRAQLGAGRMLAAARRLASLPAPPYGTRLEARLLWRLARADVARALGRRGDSNRQLTAGLADLHRYRSRLGCLDLQTGATVHGRALADAGLSWAVATGAPAEIYRWSERVRAQALRLPPVRPPADATAAAALEELRQVHYGLREAELAGRKTDELRARREILQKGLREREWGAEGQGVSADLAPLDQVRSELGDAAMVAYLRTGSTLHAWVLAGGRASVTELGPAAAVERTLLRLRADLDAQAGRAMPPRLAEAVAAATRQDAATLEDAIVRPILGRVGDRDLVVIPTGGLVAVPWAALPTCRDRAVTVAPSASAWDAAKRRLRAWSAHPVTALLVAGPGNDRGEEEVHAIAALRGPATVLKGESATPAATLAAMDSVAVAHVAAHGHHEADNPLFSTLELAGGPLTGYDLQRLVVAPAAVVLSSCDLGLADVRPGDEALGMAAALLNVGTCTVIASVARIADDTAMAVMTGFHRAAVGGRPAAAALADAGSVEPFSSFVCFGAG